MAKILLVEDDNNLRDIYGERLLAEGYDIISASDGEEALQIAAQQKPDLIISDVMMPKISGFDMLDILRQTPDTKDIKIIMMTALSQAEDKTRADSLGADKYLVKSQVTLEDVARVVHDILGDSPEEDSATEQPVANDATTGTPAAEPTMAPQPVVAAPEPPPTPEHVASPPEPTTTTPAPEPVAPAPEPAQAPAEPSVVPEPLAAAPPQPTTTPDPSVTTPVPETATAQEQSSVPAAEEPAATEPSVNPINVNDLPSEPLAGVAGSTFTPSSPAPEPTAAPATPAVDQAPVNPITGGGATPSQTEAQNDSEAQAPSADSEMADVAKQIENFVANTGQVAEHTEPVKEPSEQDLIHALNANEDPKVVPAATADSNQAEPTTPAEEQAAPAIPVNPTIPPVTSQMDAGNPEPASNRKKIIQPLNDVTTPNINDLFEKQMAEEAANSSVATPTEAPAPAPEPRAQTEVINPVLQEEEQVFNPIVTNTDPVEETTPELETIDVNSIAGIQGPEEDSSDIPIPGQLPSAPADEPSTEAPSTEPEPQAPTEPAQPEAAPEQPINPNDPNNFAL